MEVVVTATENGASTSATSDATVPVQPLNDGNASIAVPTVQQDTQVFTSSDGSWDGATGLTYAYQWKRCDVGQTCTPIPGATNKNYTAAVADVGNTLRVTVSASKGGSAVTPSDADSSPTAAIAPFPTAAPTLAGAPADTKPLTATDGAWDGATGLTETFQFSRCDAGGNNCNTVLQNTSSNRYNLVLGDIGSTIRVTVFAKKNSSASIASAASTFTSIITPLSTAAPAAPTGQTQDGQQLTALDGTWADQAGLSFRYQWYRCTPTCTALPGATSKTYTLLPADVGAKVYADTTAFVGAGAATTPSPQTLAVAPLSTAASSISTPIAQDGQLFSASTGGWNGAAGLTYTYQWRRCDTNGANCTAISNTLSTYTAGASDVGSTLEATVSASKGGSATTPSAYSQPSAVVAPRNTVRPTITGDPTDGQTLTTPASANAAWNNTPATLAFAYQWMRCDAAGANCVAIDGATTPTYKLTADDVTAATDATHARHKVEVQVTATVNGATTSVTSDVTGTIAAQTTAVTTLPHVDGGAFSNQTLNVAAGLVDGNRHLVPVLPVGAMRPAARDPDVHEPRAGRDHGDHLHGADRRRRPLRHRDRDGREPTRRDEERARRVRRAGAPEPVRHRGRWRPGRVGQLRRWPDAHDDAGHVDADRRCRLQLQLAALRAESQRLGARWQLDLPVHPARQRRRRTPSRRTTWASTSSRT